MIKSKKGVELTLKTIVIAVLLLLVLGVVLYFVIDSARNYSSTTECEERGYQCLTRDQCSQQGGSPMPALSCQNKDNVCCLKLK